MNRVLFIACIIIISLLFANASSAAPVGESAGEIWVDGPENIQPGSNPGRPDAAVDYRGRSIFVWDANPSINGGADIYLRILDVDGTSLVGPVQVNTFTDNTQDYARVAVSGDGSFLVIWQSAEVFPENEDVDRTIVRSQAFNANGAPDGEEQILSRLPTAEPGDVNADVAALPDGGYVTVWRSRRSPAPEPDNDSISIQARLLGADGVPLADQFQVHANTSAGENYPAVTELADGGFLVVWTVPEVHGRRFTPVGVPVGDAFQISEHDAGRKWEADVVKQEDGRILVVWKDEEESGDNNEIRARLYSPALVAQGTDFRINSPITGDALQPRVADYGRGGFFVVWESSMSFGGNSEPNNIEGRIVVGRDEFAGPQFFVNEWAEDTQQYPGIGGKNGRIAVAWDSRVYVDFARSVIAGQSWYICGIFCDSFE